MSETATIFAPLEDEDPARPGDPFSRLRYQYGQLLGAEDFAAEQRYHVLRERLLTATLHGYGTVRGLAVTKREDGLSGAVQLVCAPGLAVDPLGRLIHIGQEVCLDVTGLARAPFWADLAAPPGAAADARTRRAYVVLSYRACLADEVPAIAPPCSGQDAALAFSRVEDRWRLCLAAEPPPDPHPLAMDWAAAAAAGTLRERLLAFVLAPPAAVSRFWSNGDEAPLLLAVVDFEPVGDPVERTSVPGEPDNSPRALLPDVQVLAAMTTGLRLLGPGGAGPFRLVSVAARSEAGQIVLDARFTTTPDMTSLTPDAIRIFRRDGTGAWVAASFNGWSNPAPGQALITVGEDWTAPTTYQLLLRGAGAGPLLDVAGEPLSGLDGEPPLPPGAGRDVSLVARFTP
ncbi:MAG: hypothetical protein MUF65_07415 [Rubritepida sp.]|nr:hypothetical protein [Rubritepida sp.]